MNIVAKNFLNHGEIQPLHCDEGGQGFTMIHNLKRHKEIMHVQKNTSTCDFCEISFTRADNLVEHIKRAHVTETEKFKCGYCEKTFDRKWNMKRHQQKCKPSSTSN